MLSHSSIYFAAILYCLLHTVHREYKIKSICDGKHHFSINHMSAENPIIFFNDLCNFHTIVANSDKTTLFVFSQFFLFDISVQFAKKPVNNIHTCIHIKYNLHKLISNFILIFPQYSLIIRKHTNKKYDMVIWNFLINE